MYHSIDLPTVEEKIKTNRKMGLNNSEAQKRLL